MKPYAALLLILPALLLGACETMENVSYNIQKNLPEFTLPTISSMAATTDRSEGLLAADSCPRVSVVEDLSVIREFAGLGPPGEADLISGASMRTTKVSCAYTPSSVTVDLQLAFEGTLGPRSGGSDTGMPTFTYPFFVAIAAPNGEILAKEIFAASLTYDRSDSRHRYTEHIRQIIPVSGESSGSRHKVLIGFQLTGEQLAYNREHPPEPAADAPPTLEGKDTNIPVALTH